MKIANDQYSTLVARHERQEEENSKYIKMISSDVEKCEKERYIDFCQVLSRRVNFSIQGIYFCYLTGVLFNISRNSGNILNTENFFVRHSLECETSNKDRNVIKNM